MILSADALDLAVDEVAKSIQIPACPAMLSALQAEMGKEDPEPKVLANIIGRDVAMSATLLKTANSAYFNLKRKAETVEHAVAYLGMVTCSSIMQGLIARKTIPGDGAILTRFWDVSDKRAMAMQLLSRQLRVSTPDVAHTFGLFCDIGIPLLLTRFPDYSETLQLANASVDERFPSVEDKRHHTNHATIGSLLGRTWGLAPDVVMAIRLHHEYEVLTESLTPDSIKGLVALSLIVEKAIQTYQHMNKHVEWEKGGHLALEVLGMTEDEMFDICEELHCRFDAVA